MIKAGIIGATGYAGLEIARILLNHPEAELSAVSSVSFTGHGIEEVYPNLRGIFEVKLADDKTVVKESDVVFASLPHGLSEKIAADCDVQGKLFIDMGADFRLKSEDDYKVWYGGDYEDKPLHEKAVYGLPELFRAKIAKAKIIANPGCYPTSVVLGLAPLLNDGLIDVKNVIIDAKSGVTGAGRSLSQTTHFPDLNEAFVPYRIAQHRHTPEIEQTLSALSGERVTVTFVPHLLPVNRGILSTIYVTPSKNISHSELYKIYNELYKEEKFVRILPIGDTANLKNVKYSNYCDISLHMDERANRIIIVSVIDNMVKGAAGQAVQNMNIASGFKEDLGLGLIPPAF